MARSKSRVDPAAAAVAGGWALVCAHPLFAPLGRWHTGIGRADLGRVPKDGWAAIDGDGRIDAHPSRLAEPQEWAWVFAHLLLHLGFAHTEAATSGATAIDGAHIAACDVVAHRFQATLKFGRCPLPALPPTWPSGSEEQLAEQWRRTAVPDEFRGCGAADTAPDMWPGRSTSPHRPDWPQLFAEGLTAAVAAAIDVAGGARASLSAPGATLRPWELARRWFIGSYPLLGATMSTLTVVADAELARAMDIPLAAVAPMAGELYINPHAQLSSGEWRFVLAHEALHAALNHHSRSGGRDAYLYNLAADYVINGWLIEMGVGTMPEGLLFDPQLAGLSTEQVYDRIAVEARRYRKLMTLRGRAAPDIIDAGARTGSAGAGVDLDELLRRSLMTGLDLHLADGRGVLPAGLVAEIRTLAHPPLAWDVALARWFDEMFPALEPEQSYARPSRRQASTPEIPRPGWNNPEVPVTRRTFGVVLDTSGSMNQELLGKALGAIASYANARDVPAARVVYCDAAAYDAGYLEPDDIAGRVRVRGRGGTVLQPGVDLLERAPDFPADGPILVITDADCDVVRIRRRHAYLIPARATLPFTPRGPVFRLK